MAIKSALWRRLLAPAAGKRPHDREQPSINSERGSSDGWLGSAREQNEQRQED
jgi:hypothetical protein